MNEWMDWLIDGWMDVTPMCTTGKVSMEIKNVAPLLSVMKYLLWKLSLSDRPLRPASLFNITVTLSVPKP